MAKTSAHEIIAAELTVPERLLPIVSALLEAEFDFPIPLDAMLMLPGWPISAAVASGRWVRLLGQFCRHCGTRATAPSAPASSAARPRRRPLLARRHTVAEFSACSHARREPRNSLSQNLWVEQWLWQKGRSWVSFVSSLLLL
jgi:hypothetical protein